MKVIKILDTTLRDGEQSPGCSMNIEEKVEVAKQLEKLGVDVIEAGFAIASESDYEAIRAISKEMKSASVASLARARRGDIERAYHAVKEAKFPRIHTFIATSDIHLKYKLKKTRSEILSQTKEMVSYAKSLCNDIEFSCEDATRTDPLFLKNVIDTAIEAGATTINIPDTVGYTTPQEYYQLISNVVKNIPKEICISVHCHNDLGLGVANSLAAVEAGATQVECTVNGIGERAGNAALEEVVMALQTRKDQYNISTNIKTDEIIRSSSLISYITGVKVQPNKAIVGANAFAHESGIHQHGMLNNSNTYEIMTPESIGLKSNALILGKHSGKHAFVDRIKKLGFELTDEVIMQTFKDFKDLVAKKKEVFDTDIIAIIRNETVPFVELVVLKEYAIHSGNQQTTMANVCVTIENEEYRTAEVGDGPVDAAFKAIQRITGMVLKLKSYHVSSVSEREDAQGEAVIKVMEEALEYTGRGLSTDVIEASIYAYLSVLNKVLKDPIRYNDMKDKLELINQIGKV